MRRLRHWEQRVGLAGLALLRLKFAPDASPADRVIEELTAALASAADPAAQRERDYPVLSPAEGYSRWAAACEVHVGAAGPAAGRRHRGRGAAAAHG